jgi:hypothetical protein
MDVRAMVAFEVFRNNERLCVAGVGDSGVLTAIVTWVTHSPDRVKQLAAEGISEEESAPDLFLQVGGLKDRVHMDWSTQALRVGDEIKVHIIEATQVDTPTTQRHDDPANEMKLKEAYVRRLAKELGWELREA